MDRLRGTAGGDHGFTLIELLVVIIIIGVLAAIAIPVFLNQRRKGYDAQTKSDIRNVATAEETYLTEYHLYSASTDVLPGLQRSPATVSLTVLAVRNSAVNDAAGSFCVAAVSSSGTTWYYDSSTGTGVTRVACS